MTTPTRSRGRAGTAPRAGDTRRAILAAAARVFAETGLAGARIDAIAAAAGVNKALLYYYFEGKEHLYLTVIEEEFREFNRQAVGILTSAGPAGAILLRYVNLHFDTIARRAGFAPLHQQLLMMGGKAVALLMRKYTIPRSRALGRLIERGMREGVFRRGTSGIPPCRSSP